MLERKTVLITGSSQGIGFAAGVAMLNSGARVVFTSHVDLEAFPLLHRLLHQKKKATYIKADLSKDGEAERLVETAIQKCGTINVLVNNLGTFREPEFLNLTRDDFEKLFRLNVWSAIEVSREVVKHAIAKKHGGRIIFTTSLNATRSEPGHTLYDASKGAINSLTRQLAIELAPHGFTTAAIAPGLVETPLTDFGLRSDPTARDAITQQIPLKRIATVEDLAEWYAFLASDAASYSTGSIFTIDGGLDAQQMPTRPMTAAERRD